MSRDLSIHKHKGGKPKDITNAPVFTQKLVSRDLDYLANYLAPMLERKLNDLSQQAYISEARSRLESRVPVSQVHQQADRPY